MELVDTLIEALQVVKAAHLLDAVHRREARELERAATRRASMSDDLLSVVRNGKVVA